MAQQILPNGTTLEVIPTGQSFTLEEMQRLVGGYIQPLVLGQMIMLVDEDGLAKELEPNPVATAMIAHTSYYVDFSGVVGPVLVGFREEFGLVPEEPEN